MRRVVGASLLLALCASSACAPRTRPRSRYAKDPEPAAAPPPTRASAEFARPRAEIFAVAKMALEIQNYAVVLASADDRRIVTGRRLLEIEAKTARTISRYRQLDLAFEDVSGGTRVTISVRQFSGDEDVTQQAAAEDPTFARAWISIFDEMNRLLAAGPPASSSPAPTTDGGGTKL